MSYRYVGQNADPEPEPGFQPTRQMIVIGIAALVVLILLASAWGMASERVSAGEACVVRTNGKAERVALPGRVWMTPIFDDLQCFTTREVALEYTGGETNTRYTDTVISQQSSDGRDVNVAALVKFQVDPSQLVTIHNDRAKTMDDLINRVKPVIRDEVREAIDAMPITDIYPGGLAALEQRAKPGIEEALAPYGISLTAFDITRIDPDDEYEAAVRNQQQAEEDRQLALAQQQTEAEVAEKNRIIAAGEAQAKVEAANGEAEAKVIQANADAEAVRINADAEAEANEKIAASLTPELVQLAYYDALRGANWAIFSPEDVMPIMPMPTPEGGS